MSCDTSSEDIPSELIPLGQYVWPQGETRQTLEYLFDRLKSKLAVLGFDESSNDQKLHSITENDLMSSAYCRLSKLMLNCLDETYLDWINDADGPHEIRAFVHAPMRQDLLAEWAKSHGFPVVEAVDDISSVSTDGFIVIPHVQNYFLRRYDKLQNLREMLDLINKFDAKIIIGCNSWAWRYISALTAIELVVPEQHTLPAFEAMALAALLEPIVATRKSQKLFKSEATEASVFSRDEDNTLIDPYFVKLAERSLGLPWVATELFFDDMQIADDDHNKDSEVETWLKASAKPKLPPDHHRLACFVLQNVLMHEPCETATVTDCLPHPVPIGIWSALEATGFITIDDGIVRHSPSHYPAIRSALGTIGLNLDEL